MQGPWPQGIQNAGLRGKADARKTNAVDRNAETTLLILQPLQASSVFLSVHPPPYLKLIVAPPRAPSSDSV